MKLKAILAWLGINPVEYPIERFNKAGLQTYFENSDGYWQKWEYNKAGKETYYENSDGYWKKWEYNEAGKKTYHEDSSRYWEKRKYNKAGKRTYFENSNGYWWKYEYNEAGLETYFETSTGFWQKRKYNKAGKQTYWEDSDGVTSGSKNIHQEKVQDSPIVDKDTNKIKTGWMQTYTGQVFRPFATTTDMINIVDIAHALSNNCRFCGHTQFFYSVGQHSALMSRVLEDEGHGFEVQFYALLHDAAEAYVVDMPSPIKIQLKEYQQVESSIQKVILKKYNVVLTDDIKRVVKDSDTRMLITEARDVMSMPPKPWDITVAPYTHFKIELQLPEVAEKEFLLRFEELLLRRLSGIQTG